MSGVFAVCQCDHRGTVNSQTCVTRRQEFNTEGLDCGQCKVGGLSWPLNSLKSKYILVVVATEVDVHV